MEAVAFWIDVSGVGGVGGGGCYHFGHGEIIFCIATPMMFMGVWRICKLLGEALVICVIVRTRLSWLLRRVRI